MSHTAKQAIKSHAAKISEMQSAIAKLVAARMVDEPSWEMAGSLAHVANELADLRDFLLGEAR